VIGTQDAPPYRVAHPEGDAMLWAILIVSTVAAVLSEVILFRIFAPPDAMAAFLGGAWVAMPFLGAAGLAVVVRRRSAALATELVALLLASVVGISMLNNMVVQQRAAQQQVRDAVQPGEDPNSGPAGMRTSGADAGAAITDVFSVLVVAFVPPVQFTVVVIATLIGYGVAAMIRRRRVGEGGAEPRPWPLPTTADLTRSPRGPGPRR
jgi:hypothetical protein